ncbi:hypothetical protein Tco_1221842 [Tanacetum coccineum]
MLGQMCMCSAMVAVNEVTTAKTIIGSIHQVQRIENEAKTVIIGSRWRLRGTIHQMGQYEVQNSEGQYEVQNSEGSVRGSGCTRWLANHRLPRGQNDKNSVVIRRVKMKQSLVISYEAS